MLNLMAEFTGLLEREFYYDWWNYDDLMHYWHRWNQPVHRYLKKMIYIPMVKKRGYHVLIATEAVFLTSGIIHEAPFAVCFVEPTYGFVGFLAISPFLAMVANKIKSWNRPFMKLLFRLGMCWGVAGTFIHYDMLYF
ncbi:hypothetical protein ACOME3_005121 [Neoechinorhynchus agilis]